MKLHAIGGMPRAGTTLACNVICQRPDAYATTTSCLAGMVRALGNVAANRIEFKNLLNRDLAGTQDRFADSVQAFCEQWHSVHGKETVFDKSRAWNNMPNALRDISPDGKIIMFVRDLRDIFASTEIAERRNGLISVAPSNIHSRYQEIFSPTGVIGGPYHGVLDVLNTAPDNVLFLRYEDFIAEPLSTMRVIEDFCDMEPFDYDFDNVPDIAGQIEPDGFWLGKFPHRASGRITPINVETWHGVVPKDIAADIMAKASRYNEVFQYEGEAKDMPKIDLPKEPPEYTEADRQMDQILLNV